MTVYSKQVRVNKARQKHHSYGNIDWTTPKTDDVNKNKFSQAEKNSEKVDWHNTQTNSKRTNKDYFKQGYENSRIIQLIHQEQTDWGYMVK